MRKVRLALDSLAVASFAAAADAPFEGTARGHADSYPGACDPPSDSVDPAYHTCGRATCAGATRAQSCNGTCPGCPSVGCGSGACPSRGVTRCWGTPSCIEECDPPGS